MTSAPQDYVDVLKSQDPSLTEAEMANKRSILGLDRPVYEQYIFWLVGRNTKLGDWIDFVGEFGNLILLSPFRAAQDWGIIDLGIPANSFRPGFIFGNMGESFKGTSINTMIGAKAWETMKLQLASLLMSLMIGIPLGIMSARRPYSKLDSMGTTLALFGVSMPVFWTGIMFILLFADFRIFPFLGLDKVIEGVPEGFPFPALGSTSPNLNDAQKADPVFMLMDELLHMVLPTIVLGLAGTALILRLTRSSMLEVLRQDYILTARSKGLPERIVIYKHALRNALMPVVTVVGLSIGFLLAGAALTETVFSWPGLGKEAVYRIGMRDYNFMMGINMLISIMVIFANLLTDIAYAFLDPRIRF
jgi:peptide/nickel transport system permease protein